MSEPRSKRIKLTHSGPTWSVQTSDRGLEIISRLTNSAIHYGDCPVFDLLDSLPAELIHQIFSYVYDLSPQKVGSTPIVFNLEKTGEFPFSPTTKRGDDPLWRARFLSQMLQLRGEVPLDGRIADQEVICITLEQLLDMEQHYMIEFRNITVPDLIWSLQQNSWPSIQLNGLLAFMGKLPARQGDNVGMFLAQLDSSSFNTTYNNRGPDSYDPSAHRHRLLDQPFHFKSVQQAMMFFDRDPSRQYQIQAMSVHYTDWSVRSIALALQPMLDTIHSRTRICFIAHVKGGAGDKDGLGRFIGKLTMRSSGQPTVKFCIIPLSVASLEFVQTATNTQLQTVADDWLDSSTAQSISLSELWPPSYFEWNRGSQKLLGKHFVALSRVMRPFVVSDVRRRNRLGESSD